ncbi:hypothetical protein QR680_003813 [Steinernema hermaphroditum]|uniref:Uncharacterized protein n=1 Tax=Steinernema hermaphroditum TaxID=289476 RepID=A0AA39HLN0_9BILA|nr:hypothetical protein QR680_003813 [Steinernema hermaphroditum]
MDTLPFAFYDAVISSLDDPLPVTSIGSLWSPIAMDHIQKRISISVCFRFNGRFEECTFMKEPYVYLNAFEFVDLLQKDGRFVRIKSVFIMDSLSANLHWGRSTKWTRVDRSARKRLLQAVAAKYRPATSGLLYMPTCKRTLQKHFLKKAPPMANLSMLKLGYVGRRSEKFLQTTLQTCPHLVDLTLLGSWTNNVKDAIIDFIHRSTNLSFDARTTQIDFDYQEITVIFDHWKRLRMATDEQPGCKTWDFQARTTFTGMELIFYTSTLTMNNMFRIEHPRGQTVLVVSGGTQYGVWASMFSRTWKDANLN